MVLRLVVATVVLDPDVDSVFFLLFDADPFVGSSDVSASVFRCEARVVSVCIVCVADVTLPRCSIGVQADVLHVAGADRSLV